MLRNAIRFILFILVQVFVLFQIQPLHRFIVPYVYFLYILWLPFNMSRTNLLLLSFIYGLALDAFAQTPGLHAAACVLIAYVRGFMISLLLILITELLFSRKEKFRTNTA